MKCEDAERLFVIDAMRWTGINRRELKEFCGDISDWESINADPGDYILMCIDREDRLSIHVDKDYGEICQSDL